MKSRHQLLIVWSILVPCALTHGVDTCKYVTIPICDNSPQDISSVAELGNGARGPVGPPGKVGPRGYIGQKGEKGEQGAQGPMVKGANHRDIEQLNETLRDICIIRMFEILKLFRCKGSIKKRPP